MAKVPNSSNIADIIKDFEAFSEQQASVVAAVKSSVNSVKAFASITIDKKVKEGLKNMKNVKKTFNAYSVAISDMAKGISNMIPSDLENDKKSLQEKISLLTGDPKATEQFFASDGKTVTSSKTTEQSKGILDALTDVIGLFKSLAEIKAPDKSNLKKAIVAYTGIIGEVGGFLMTMVESEDSSKMKESTESAKNMMESMLSVTTLLESIKDDLVPTAELIVSSRKTIENGLTILYNSEKDSFSIVSSLSSMTDEMKNLNKAGVGITEDITDSLKNITINLITSAGVLGLPLVSRAVAKGMSVLMDTVSSMEKIGDTAGKLSEENFDTWITVSGGLAEAAAAIWKLSDSLMEAAFSILVFQTVTRSKESSSKALGIWLYEFFDSIKIPAPREDAFSNAEAMKQLTGTLSAAADDLAGLSSKIIFSYPLIYLSIKVLGEVYEQLGDEMKDSVGIIASWQIDRMAAAFKSLASASENLTVFADTMPKPKKVRKAISTLVTIGDMLGDEKTKDKFLEALSAIELISNEKSKIESLSEIVDSFKNVMKSAAAFAVLAIPGIIGLYLMQLAAPVMSDVVESLVGITDGIDEKRLESAKESYENMKSLVVSCGIMIGVFAIVGALVILAFKPIALGFIAITVVVIAFAGILKLIDLIGGKRGFRDHSEAIQGVGRLMLLAGAVIAISVLVGLLVTKALKLILIGLLGLTIVSLLMIGIMWIISKVGEIPGLKTGMIMFLAMCVSMMIAALMIKIIGKVGSELDFVGLLVFIGALAIITATFAGIGFLMASGGILLVLAAAVSFILMAASLMLMALSLKMVNNVMSSTKPEDAISNIKGMLDTMKFTIDYLEENISIKSAVKGMAKMAMLMAVSLNMMWMAMSIRKIANLTMTEFDANGRPTGGIVKMKTKDFTDAALNGTAIVQTIASLFKDGETEINTSAGKFTVRGLSEEQLNGITLSTKRKMRQLRKITRNISQMARVITGMASLKMETEWDKDGKPIAFQKMTTKDFTDTALNGIAIVKMIAAILDDNETEIVTSAGKVTVSGLSEETFEKITGKAKRKIKRLKKITSAIGGMAKTIANIASLKIETKWNEKGQAIEYEAMTGEMFVNTALNGIAVMKMMAAILDDESTEITYSGGKVTVTGLSEDVLESITGKAKRKIEKLRKITDSIGSMANTIANMASLNVPTQWNEEGQAIKYEPMTGEMFANTAVNGIAIVKMMAAVLDDEATQITYSGGSVTVTGLSEDVLESITGKAKRKLKRLGKITSSVGTMSNVIAEIAAMNIPTKWNEEGEAIEYRQMTSDDFKNAGLNGVSIVKIMAAMLDDEETSIDLSTGSVTISGLSEDDLDKISGKARRKLNRLADITSCIGSMAESIQSIAALAIPTKWNEEGVPTDFRQMNIGDFTQAALNGVAIVRILAAMLDDGPSIITTSAGPVLVNGLRQDTLDNISRYAVRKMEQLNAITSCVANMAESIKNVASMSIPYEWDENGAPKSFKKMSNDDYKTASENVVTIMTVLMDAITSDSLGGKITLFDGWKAKNMAKLFEAITPISDMVNAVLALAGGSMDEFDASGHPTGNKISLQKAIESKADIIAAITNIYTIFTDAIKVITAEPPEPQEPPEGGSKLGRLVKKVAGVVKKVVSQVSGLVKGFFTKAELDQKSSQIMAVVSPIGSMVDAVKKILEVTGGVDDTSGEKFFDITAWATQAMAYIGSQNISSYQKDINTLNSGLRSMAFTVMIVGGSFKATSAFTKTIDAVKASAVSVNNLAKSINSESGRKIGNMLRDAISGITDINAAEMRRFKTRQKALQTYTRTVHLLMQAGKGSDAAKNIHQVMEDSGKFIVKLNKTDESKLAKMASIAKNMAEFAKRINGNFDKLADTMNEKMVTALEKVDETLKEVNKTMTEVPNKIAASRTSSLFGGGGSQQQSAAGTDNKQADKKDDKKDNKKDKAGKNVTGKSINNCIVQADDGTYAIAIVQKSE